ncbi:heparinase II/III-family protein [Tessaracoccus sp. OS52]|uniref:heparinase II/III domain-containing protein n=1 Tax=Tessaracoccus sp. OS52 TaxID=2886691 RepID=UPI001D10CD40|nr:heparinase II/III family protein [Tessaracoccus sp. OS52]MCC2594542.1 heparinase II/III-family protein [Tessaracoccus sp. OS52]
MADRYQEPGLDEHSIDETSRWDFYSGQPTPEFRLHNLNHLRVLTESYRSTGDSSQARQADVLAHRWLRVRGTPDDSPAWHGHPVALRTATLAYLYAAGFSPDARMREALQLHAEFLADPNNYEGAWNHGLDQDIALLQAGRALGDAEVCQVAADRVEEAAPALVDGQGVVAEQATTYALYIYQRLGVVSEELKRAGLPITPALRRRDQIPAFLSWATRPDRVMVPVGDSRFAQLPSLAGTEFEFPATGGETGTPPPARSMFYDDGWGFIRSGWGEARPYPDESHLTVRYGTFRRIHGHRDHTSVLWYTGGRPVLDDPGFTGYGDKAIRQYELAETSHSMVTVEGAGGYCWDKGTELLHQSRFTLDDDHEVHLLHLGGYAYPDVMRTRSILHIPALDVLVVRDAITAPKPVTVNQTWQFGASFSSSELSPDGQTARLTDPAGSAVLTQLLPVNAVEDRFGRTEPQAGWVAVGEGRRAPAHSLRFSRRGAQVAFLTAITTRDDLAVDLASEGAIRVRLASVSPEPLVVVRFDPATGFLPTARRPRATTRWDHRED